MSWWRKVEKTLRPWAVPNLTQVMIVGQVAAFALGLIKPEFANAITLEPDRVLSGEWWRVFTFLFTPTASDPIFLILGLMFLNLIGNALEGHLGTVRYNLFVLTSVGCSVVTAVIVGLFEPGLPAIGNEFVYGSLFLAFAWLYPDFNLMIYFIIPVKVKWLALLTVFLYAVSFSKGLSNLANGGWVTCLIILAGNLNLLLFFGTDFYYFLRSRQRRMTQQVKQIHASQKPRHVCVVCGANNLTHPQYDFRYCPECEGTPAYCQDHLPGHTHLGPQRASGKMPL